MLQELDQKILKAKDDIKRKEKIKDHLRELDLLMAQRQREAARLGAILQKEQADYEKVNSGGLHRAFYLMLGSLKENVEKEHQEYLYAYMDYCNCLEAIKQITDEKVLLENILDGLFHVEKELEQLLERKAVAIPMYAPELKDKIALADQTIFSLHSKLREISEAIVAGLQVKKQLTQIVADLQMVSNWGEPVNYESTTEKKKYIDRAQSEANKADRLLQRFQKELQDIGTKYSLSYETEIKQLHLFIHQYCNNLIVDWVLKKKISNTISGVNQTKDNVDLILITLYNEQEKAKQNIEEQKERKRLLLMG
jgi:hypothetical protein